jgi:hypothetical protein
MSAFVLAALVAALLAVAVAPAFAAEACPNQELRQLQRSTGLPDCRAYELVSPPEKSGSDVIQQTTKTHVAADGDGVTFSSLGAFGELQGTSFDTEYLSRRTGAPGTNGWNTVGIRPPGASDTINAIFTENNQTFVNAFTPDLSAAVYRAWYPLTDAPNVAEVSNFYRVTGLGGAGPGVQLLSDGVTPLPPWTATAKQLATPGFVGASTDLQHVVFESKLNLTADAPPYSAFCELLNGLAGCRTRLYENTQGTVRLAGRIPSPPDTECDDVTGPVCVAAPSSQAGISPTQYSGRMVSADGRRVLFQAPAVAEPGAIYMREDDTRTVLLAHEGVLWTASADGSRVFFTTGESLLPEDTDSAPDLYMYNADAAPGEHLTLISASATANDGNVGAVLGASDDGHYVYFTDAGQLLAGEPAADLAGLYLWHEGRLAYIGSLRDSAEGVLNSPRTGWKFESEMSTVRVSPDGLHLLFITHDGTGFTGRDGFAGSNQDGHQELYLYDAETNSLACASCNPDGAEATSDASSNVRVGAAASAGTTKLSHALSDDGRYVFFSTAEPLVAQDTNGTSDAYEYDALTGTVRLLSGGTDPAPSYFIDASNDGQNAFFVTRAQLVGWDTDDNYDLYDARVGGGLPEPVAAAPPCAGDGCRAQRRPPPASTVPASSVYIGAANTTATPRATATRPKPRRRCPRNTVARRVKHRTRCVRTHRRHLRHTTHAAAGSRDRRSAP